MVQYNNNGGGTIGGVFEEIENSRFLSKACLFLLYYPSEQ